MNFFLIGSFSLFILYLFFIIGSYLNKILNIIKNSDLLDLTILGYALFVIISFHSYFVLNLKNIYLLGLIIIFFLFYHTQYLYLISNNFKNLTKYSVIVLFYFLVFYIPIKIYGEQFYVFRGNYWDNFNYLTSALIFNKYSFFDTQSLNFFENFKNFQSIESIVVYRPYINYFLSLYLNIKLIDVFLLNFSFKIFLSILNFLAFVSFLRIFKKINENSRILLSFIFSFSFFSLYIFETETLSHLGSISLLLISIKYLYILSLKNEDNKIKCIFFISLINGALFIIYPEIFIFFFIIFLSYFLVQFYKLKSKFKIKNYFIYSLFFFLITISSYETNYEFLLIQISHALRSDVHWWSYFGAFIIGRDNLILDINYIDQIKDSINGQNIFQLLKTFYFDHVKEGYNLIFLNFIPSFFGMYYLTGGKIISTFSYILYFISFFISLYLLNILSKNIIFIYKKRIKIIYISFLIIFFSIIYLILKGSFWTVIKIYSYSLIFIFISISIDFKKQKINKIIILILLIFPFYKYSNFNFGIGTIDSFPSIINKDYKSKINWNLNKKDLLKCKKVFSSEKDYFVRAYINIKTLYADKTFENSINLGNKKKYCKVSVIGKNYVVASIK